MNIAKRTGNLRVINGGLSQAKGKANKTPNPKKAPLAALEPSQQLRTLQAKLLIVWHMGNDELKDILYAGVGRAYDRLPLAQREVY